MKKMISLLLFILITPCLLVSQQITEAPKPADAPPSSSAQSQPAAGPSVGAGGKSAGFTPFPIIAYSGATSLMLGAILFVNFVDMQNENAETDRVQLMGIYTLNHQIITNGGIEKYFYDDRIQYKGFAGFIRFPTDFYGVGSANSQQKREEYSSDSVPVSQSLLFRLTERGTSKIWIGPSYYFKYVNYHDIEQGGLLDNGAVSGIDGTRVSAPGVKFLYDARDNTLWTTSGNCFEAEMRFNTRAAGATQNSASVKTDYRHFWDLAAMLASLEQRSYVIGLHAYYSAQGGDVPLTLMNEMGGGGSETILRGYDERYLDKCKYALEGELRYPIWNDFAGTVFGGFGNVAGDPAGFVLRQTHYAAGIGIRYAIINTEDKMNLRFDIAFNREGSVETVFNVMEAF